MDIAKLLEAIPEVINRLMEEQNKNRMKQIAEETADLYSLSKQFVSDGAKDVRDIANVVVALVADAIGVDVALPETRNLSECEWERKIKHMLANIEQLEEFNRQN
jgi:hypothetical protein